MLRRHLRPAICNRCGSRLLSCHLRSERSAFEDYGISFWPGGCKYSARRQRNYQEAFHGPSDAR
jgi:hypothetical protein